MKYSKIFLKSLLAQSRPTKTVAAIAFAVTVFLSAYPANGYQSYHTLKLANSNLALNSNNSFRRINGQPRMSVSVHNTSDRDQQFIPLGTPTEVYFRLQHRSTGQCLNVYNPNKANGAEVNLWDCDEDDKDQWFTRRPFQGNTYQLQTFNGNLCVDSPSRDRYGRVHVWTCDRDNRNPNQQWTEVTAR